MDGDDDSSETGEDGESFLQGHAFVEKNRREQRDNHGREKDQDVEDRQSQVAQRDDDRNIVAQVESGAEKLRSKLMRLEGDQIATKEPSGKHEQRHEEAEEGEGLIPWQAGLVDELDGRVGEHPQREAGDGEGDGLEVGEAGHNSS